MVTKDTAVIDAMTRANVLHVEWQGAIRKAADVEAAQDAIVVQANEAYTAAIKGTGAAIEEAKNAADEAKQKLIAHQEQAYETLGVQIDLTAAHTVSGGQTRL